MYMNLFIKTVILYFYIVIAYRIMGKREVGKLSVTDLIVSILIADLAAITIEQYKFSVMISLIPITTLVALEMVLGFLSMKNDFFRKTLDGDPTVIIKNGKLKFSEMTKLRYSLDDLASQLREHGIKSIEEVKYAVLENDGKLSVFPNETEYPLPIIIDGKIDNLVLKDMKKSKKWVMNILKEKNIPLDQVFYAFYTKQKTYIIKKSDLV